MVILVLRLLYCLCILRVQQALSKAAVLLLRDVSWRSTVDVKIQLALKIEEVGFPEIQYAEYCIKPSWVPLNFNYFSHLWNYSTLKYHIVSSKKAQNPVNGHRCIRKIREKSQNGPTSSLKSTLVFLLRGNHLAFRLSPWWLKTIRYWGEGEVLY